MHRNELPQTIRETIRRGGVIPAHPLALDEQGRFDSRYQRALSRYYVEAGAIGVAVGVHSTQFEIRDSAIGLFEPVLALASEAMDQWEDHLRSQSRWEIACPGSLSQITGEPLAEDDRLPPSNDEPLRLSRGPMLKVAGVCGNTDQAVSEAGIAESHGYHAALLSLAGMADATEQALLEHCRAVSQAMPLWGFYLQPAVGGRELGYEFWRGFFEIDNVVAVKAAPFCRYRTLEVVRALADSGRAGEVVLYTGNDDNIIIDLLTEFRLGGDSVRVAGGLLGHWAVWTRRAVEQVEAIKRLVPAGEAIPASLLRLGAEITEANGAFFDAANGFKGCIPGIHELLRGQGLLPSRRCLDPRLDLSPGQGEAIERVQRQYPHLADDDFVREHLDRWLGD